MNPKINFLMTNFIENLPPNFDFENTMIIYNHLENYEKFTEKDFADKYLEYFKIGIKMTKEDENNAYKKIGLAHMHKSAIHIYKALVEDK